jgi:outer membrane protein assembly factor BamA
VALICAFSGPSRAQELVDEAPPEEFRNYFVPVPVIYYTPETKLAFGVSGAYIYRTDPGDLESRPSTLGGIAIYTTRNQIITALGFDHYFDRDRQQLEGVVAYQKFPDDFYGIGNDTPADDPDDYTDEAAAINLDYVRVIRGDWRAGGGFLFGTSSITGVDPGDLLDGDIVPGSGGGQVLGAGILARYDSRDKVGYPVSGAFHQLAWRVHGEVLGADFAFNQTTADLRQYLPLGGKRVVAIRALGMANGGTVPFQMLPALGGDQLMRGYYAGRFRERQLLASQVEYRSYVWKRLGFAAFGAVGQVAHDWSDMRLDDFRFSYGLGLRFLLISQEGMNLRADFGFGEDQSAFYIGFSEAF